MSCVDGVSVMIAIVRRSQYLSDRILRLFVWLLSCTMPSLFPYTGLAMLWEVFKQQTSSVTGVHWLKAGQSSCFELGGVEASYRWLTRGRGNRPSKSLQGFYQCVAITETMQFATTNL